MYNCPSIQPCSYLSVCLSNYLFIYLGGDYKDEPRFGVGHTLDSIEEESETEEDDQETKYF